MTSRKESEFSQNPQKKNNGDKIVEMLLMVERWRGAIVGSLHKKRAMLILK